MSAIHRRSSNNVVTSCVKGTIQACWVVPTLIVATVAFSVIGPLGTMGSLAFAAYKGIRLNHHWRHTREKNSEGKLISETELNQMKYNPKKNYMSEEAEFTVNDLSRLKNERKRLQDEKSAIAALKWARGLAKCSIPIVGPIWAMFTEFNGNGSVSIRCAGCMNHSLHMTPEERVNEHIKNLQRVYR